MKQFYHSNDEKYFIPLLYLGVLYITAMIAADLLTYRMVPFLGKAVSCSLFIFPLTYSLGDITAEVYGRHIAVRLVIITLLADFLIDTFLSLSLHIPTVSAHPDMMHSLNKVFSPLQQVFWGNFLGIAVGSIINVKLMSKLKAIYSSRFFLLRSIGSTFCGEIVYTVVAYLVWFKGISSLHDIEIMIAVSMGFKVVFAAFSALPSFYISKHLSLKENMPTI